MALHHTFSTYHDGTVITYYTEPRHRRPHIYGEDIKKRLLDEDDWIQFSYSRNGSGKRANSVYVKKGQLTAEALAFAIERAGYGGGKRSKFHGEHTVLDTSEKGVLRIQTTKPRHWHGTRSEPKIYDELFSEVLKEGEEVYINRYNLASFPRRDIGRGGNRLASLDEEERLLVFAEDIEARLGIQERAEKVLEEAKEILPYELKNVYSSDGSNIDGRFFLYPRKNHRAAEELLKGFREEARLLDQHTALQYEKFNTEYQLLEDNSICITPEHREFSQIRKNPHFLQDIEVTRMVKAVLAESGVAVRELHNGGLNNETAKPEEVDVEYANGIITFGYSARTVRSRLGGEDPYRAAIEALAQEYGTTLTLADSGYLQLDLSQIDRSKLTQYQDYDLPWEAEHLQEVFAKEIDISRFEAGFRNADVLKEFNEKVWRVVYDKTKLELSSFEPEVSDHRSFSQQWDMEAMMEIAGCVNQTLSTSLSYEIDKYKKPKNVAMHLFKTKEAKAIFETLEFVLPLEAKEQNLTKIREMLEATERQYGVTCELVEDETVAGKNPAIIACSDHTKNFRSGTKAAIYTYKIKIDLSNLKHKEPQSFDLVQKRQALERKAAQKPEETELYQTYTQLAELRAQEQQAAEAAARKAEEERNAALPEALKGADPFDVIADAIQVGSVFTRNYKQQKLDMLTPASLSIILGIAEDGPYRLPDNFYARITELDGQEGVELPDNLVRRALEHRENYGANYQVSSLTEVTQEQYDQYLEKRSRTPKQLTEAEQREKKALAKTWRNIRKNLTSYAKKNEPYQEGVHLGILDCEPIDEATIERAEALGLNATAMQNYNEQLQREFDMLSEQFDRKVYSEEQYGKPAFGSIDEMHTFYDRAVQFQHEVPEAVLNHTMILEGGDMPLAELMIQLNERLEMDGADISLEALENLRQQGCNLQASRAAI